MLPYALITHSAEVDTQPQAHSTGESQAGGNEDLGVDHTYSPISSGRALAPCESDGYLYDEEQSLMAVAVVQGR